jgi:hypothetical protein
MLALLDRSDNDNCVIPAWRAPSLLAVQKDTSLSHAAVVKTLRHLEMHGWLERTGQKAGQKAGTKRSGRGRTSTRWALLPLDFAPPSCTCTKPDRPPRSQSGAEIGHQGANPDWITDAPCDPRQNLDCTKGGRDEGESRWGGPGGWDVPYSDAS